MPGNDVRWSKTQGSQALRGAIAIAVVMLIGIIGHFVFMPEEPIPREAQAAEPPAQQPQAQEPQAQPPQAQQTQAQPPQLARKPPPARTPRSIATPQPEESWDAGEISISQIPRGNGGGIDAFPRPGTKPILRGIIVPENYPLPEGYVRHVQTTDDGRELPPILMFHPDYHPPGVVIPENRVVPENLAPPGMPIEWLEPPSSQR